MPNHSRYVAFWSYTRFDDEHDGQWLTDLRIALEKEVQALSGFKVAIFQDVDGILWGNGRRRSSDPPRMKPRFSSRSLRLAISEVIHVALNWSNSLNGRRRWVLTH
jgi:hypothetical protein